ncbi:IS630 family transposase [Fulvivirga sp. M361]|uniref:IS630 family transposase n=1 Tax=Fulvivirga sp. M361 TaxID=2594266 RepID=UPI00117B2C6C|nr:IS630 family transposase [Fulvivirga sp. M361]TRX44911.1 IS630 family transposase [Fulvivirga sp. M361]
MRTTQKPKLILSSTELNKLKTISRSQTAAHREVMRAKILLKYVEGLPLTSIARDLNTNRPLVDRCINKAIAYGALTALKDLPGRGVKPVITDDAKSWVLSIACQSPRELGYAHETWTYSLLKQHIRAHCHKAGYEMLSKIDKGVLNKILSQANIKPHKVSYYLEKRDPDFEVKMAHVLQVYKEIALINEIPQDEGRKATTLSYDEKPGIQAIKNIAPQLQPTVGKYPTLQRDHEYKRLGTVSLLAGIDLHTGKVIPLVRDRHRSREFIEFLTEVDKQYPGDWKIRMVLDNHSSHVSKETKAWLLNKPGRFEFVFTPKHGSWLNMIEMFFSKMARSFLRHIRVDSKKELIERIYQGISAINEEPVVFKWKYKMDDLIII